MKITRLFFTVSLFSVSLLQAETAVRAEAPAHLDATHEKHHHATRSHTVTGIAWKNESAKLFDLILGTKLFALSQIHKASVSVTKAVTNLKSLHPVKHDPSKEADVVKTQIAESLALVRPFLDDIRDQKALLLPLFAETAASHKLQTTYLTKFLNGTENLDTFVGREIKSIPALQNLLTEIQSLFADLFASLSDNTKKNYKAFLAANSKQKPSTHVTPAATAAAAA